MRFTASLACQGDEIYAWLDRIGKFNDAPIGVHPAMTLKLIHVRHAPQFHERLHMTMTFEQSEIPAVDGVRAFYTTGFPPDLHLAPEA